MSCDHIERRQVWVETYNEWTGETEGNWEWQEECLQKDIDLHRFKCTRCGEVGYYSGAARRYYEGGATKDDIDRLGLSQ